MIVLDTDVLIDVQRGLPAALHWFGTTAETLVVPGFVAMELIQDARNSREVQAAVALFRPFQIVWPNDRDCAKALTDFTALHLSHSPGLLDSLIAATAIGLAAPLCTYNVKHFQIVPGLQTVQPY